LSSLSTALDEVADSLNDPTSIRLVYSLLTLGLALI